MAKKPYHNGHDDPDQDRQIANQALGAFSSRQLWLAFSFSSSGRFTVSPAHQAKRLNADNLKQVYNGWQQILAWGYFDNKGYRIPLFDGGAPPLSGRWQIGESIVGEGPVEDEPVNERQPMRPGH